MKKGMTQKYSIRILVLAFVGALAVLFSMNRSEAAPEGVGVKNVDEFRKEVSNGTERIYLTSDISWGSKYYTVNFTSGKNVTLDLNGHDIIMNNSPRICYFNVSSGTTLTICDTSSTDGDKQGRIRHGGGFYGGGVRVDGEGSKLILESGGISECEATCGGAVAVLHGASFEMNGGYIELSRTYGQSKNNESAGNGNGVYVAKGTFTMNGGCIRGNNAGNTESHNGGAVWVGEEAVFTMNGGKIGDRQILSSKYYGTQGGENISQGNGGAIYVGGGECYLNSGVIDSNTANGKLGGGAVFVGEGGTLEIKSEVQLLANRANENGGAIYIDRPKSCVINGVTIDGGTSGANATRGGAIYVSSNTTQDITVKDVVMKRLTSADGGAVYSEGGKLNLSNVTMSNCSSSGNGGAMVMSGQAAAVIENGTITGNDARYGDINKYDGLGGAIYLSGESTCVLKDTTVSNNIANNGGGIYVSAYSSLTLDGGSVINNTADENYYFAIVTAGGIWAEGQVSVGGNLKVKGNKQYNRSQGSEDSDILLARDILVNASSILTDGAEIGLLSADCIYNKDPILVTSGYENNNWRTAPEKYFFSDDPTYYVQKNPHNDEKHAFFHEAYLMKEKHTHDVYFKEGTPSTCVKEGKKSHFTCRDCVRIFEDSNCEKEIIESELTVDIDKNNHVGGEYTEEELLKEASCTETGAEEVTVICSSCKQVKEVYQAEIAALGHDLKDITELGGQQGHGQKCTRAGCNYMWFVPDPPALCDHSDLDEHERIEPTCTTGGMKAYAICKTCGKYFGYDEESNKYDITKALSDDDINLLALNPLGHSVKMANEGQDDGEPMWIIDETSVVSPDCTNDGSHDEYTVCRRCETHISTRTVVEPALGHEFGPVYVEDCLLQYKCIRGDATAAFGECHNIVEVPELEATCISDGHNAYFRCINCERIFDHTFYKYYGMPLKIDFDSLIIPSLGHDFGEWEMIEEPDANHTGTEMRKCSRCDAVETRDMGIEVAYEFVKGDGSKWTKGDEGTLDFTVKRSYKDEDTFDEWFTGEVLVDDKELSTADFDASKGSVALKLKDSYLNTLEVGEHTLTVVFEDEYVSADFEVVEKDTEEESTEDTTEKSSEDVTEEPTDDTTETSTGDTTEEVTESSTDDTTETSTGDTTEEVTESSTEASSEDATDGTTEEVTDFSTDDTTEVSSEDVTGGPADTSTEVTRETSEEITNSEAEIKTEATTENKDNSVKTNDSTPVILIIVCAVLSAAMIVFCVIMKKRRGNGSGEESGDE